MTYEELETTEPVGTSSPTELSGTTGDAVTVSPLVETETTSEAFTEVLTSETPEITTSVEVTTGPELTTSEVVEAFEVFVVVLGIYLGIGLVRRLIR